MTSTIATFMIVVSMSVCAIARQQQPAANPPPLPTMAELHEMYEGGDYRLTVQQIARVMRLKGAPAQAYDIDQLQLLRGKALLALEDPTSARRALQEALQSAQPDVAVPARALVALINRSSSGTYQPKSRNAEPISIYAPASRQHALRAVLDDELPRLGADAERAVADETLATSIELMPRLIDLHCIERVVTDADEQTGPIARSIGEHARTLIQRELTLQEARISGIERMANQYIQTGGAWRGGRRWWSSGYTRRGLISDEREDLYQLVQYLAKVEDTARQAQQVATAFNGDAKAWDETITQATSVKTHAQAVLDAEGVRTVDTSR